jgi:SulP family sulfate permease
VCKDCVFGGTIKVMFEKLTLTLPLHSVLQTYKRAYLHRDLVAGATVAAVAVPQAMAYAQLAGVNLTAGLYAAMVAMVVFAVVSSSRYVILGPDAAMAALAGAAVIPLAGGDADRAVALVAILAFFIGLASIVSVIARIGFVAEFLSRPILLGYMAGLALVVIATQLPKVFGVESTANTNFLGSVAYLITNLTQFHGPTVVLGLTAVVIAVLLMRVFRHFPVSLFILIIGTLFSWFFDFASMGIATVGNIPVGLPVPDLPSIELNDLQNLIVPALAMMLIAYANTIANARTYAAKNKDKVSSDQEFLGLGLANVASGLYGGMPVSASSARTAVNYTSRAKTQVSQLFGALCIAIVLAVLSPLLQYLPITLLAVIIILAVIPLFNYKELKSIWHAWRSEAILAVVTMIGVTTLGIYQGLLLAVMLAVLNMLRKSAFPNDAILGIAHDGSVRDMHRPPKTHEIPGLKIYRFDAPLYFGNANYFRYRVLQIIDESKEPIHWFLWDAETITAIDSTSGQMLLGLIEELRTRDITFAVARMKGSIRTIVHKTHRLNSALQHSPHYSSIGDAIEAYREEYKISRDYEI